MSLLFAKLTNWMKSIFYQLTLQKAQTLRNSLLLDNIAFTAITA